MRYSTHTLKPFGPYDFELRIEPTAAMSKSDWAWLRDKVLKPAGFTYSGRGQADWYLVIGGSKIG
jgi:hypothetical protein